MHVAPDRHQVLLPVEHEVVEVLLQAAVELRDEVQGGTAELGAGADEPARRPDQPELVVASENVLTRAPQNSGRGQRVRERHEVGVGLEGPHARELVHFALAVLHDEPG